MSHPIDECFEEGVGEGFKAGIHLGLFGLAVACLAYNTLAFTQRREKHLARNIGVYSFLAWYEAEQIRAHLRD